MKNVLIIFFLLFSFHSLSQSAIEVTARDSSTNEPISDLKISIKGINKGGFTNDQGTLVILDVPIGKQTLIFTSIGYVSKQMTVEVLSNETTRVIVLMSTETQLVDEVYVEATRSNRSIANLPTRTEVLTDEIDEAAAMEPSKIAHLITHSTGIQVQTTSASSNGAVVRVQGMNGRYTQLLKDGFPLYGGFSGSLDVMQIPPLDLRQVEYIKGSASTLYGGGAIGGLINLISKKPQKEETLLHINLSHIGSKDFNVFSSEMFGKFGMTTLASFHHHTRYDADSDGYSDLPEVAKVNFNPKLFWYPNEKNELYLGAMVSNESRMGGDVRLIDDYEMDSTHFFYDKQKSNRYTSQFQYKHFFDNKSSFTIKNSLNAFNRNIRIRRNVLGEMTNFGGMQFNSFSELNFNLVKTNHVLNVGFNAYSDRFDEQELDTNVLRDQQYLTFGVYINHLWDINKSLALETGLRTDRVTASSLVGENKGEFFVLPRLSMLYKMTKTISLRLGGGLGYRMPTIFNEESEPYGYQNIQPIDLTNVKAERSYGANFDVKYLNDFGSDNLLLSLNQMFFYNIITDPILLTSDTLGNLSFTNSGHLMHSRGFESQIKLTVWKFTWFLGYTYTDAYIETAVENRDLLLNPKHSIKGDLLFVVDGKWRIGWDYEYKSQQLLSSGLRSRTLFSTGIIVERTIGNFVIFTNAENFTDTRQTRYESLLTGPNNTPQFTDIWAPLDGFFFNAGLKLTL